MRALPAASGRLNFQLLVDYRGQRVSHLVMDLFHTAVAMPNILFLQEANAYLHMARSWEQV